MKLMSKSLFAALLSCGLFLSAAPAVAAGTKIGVVDFRRCFEESKFGKKEQESLESMRKQMAEALEKTDKELTELARKIQDPEYLDSLSPEGEEELKIRYQTLAAQIQQQQGQFYQMLQQAEMRVIQELTVQVNRASQIVAKAKSLDYIARDEAFFYYEANSNVTSDVVTELNKAFDKENA